MRWYPLRRFWNERNPAESLKNPRSRQSLRSRQQGREPGGYLRKPKIPHARGTCQNLTFPLHVRGRLQQVAV